MGNISCRRFDNIARRDQEPDLSEERFSSLCEPFFTCRKHFQFFDLKFFKRRTARSKCFYHLKLGDICRK